MVATMEIVWATVDQTAMRIPTDLLKASTVVTGALTSAINPIQCYMATLTANLSIPHTVISNLMTQ